MRLTRKELIGGAAAASALAATGIYKLVDQLTAPPARVTAGATVPAQHLLAGIHVALDNGAVVLNIHTDAFQPGEISGDVTRAGMTHAH